MAITFSDMTEELVNDNLLIVDGLNIAFRWLHNRNRAASGWRYGFDYETEYIRTVKSLAKSYNCANIVVLGDGGSFYRKELYPEYKANRKDKLAEQTPEEQKEFEAFIKEFDTTMKALKTKEDALTLRFHGVEADDIAAYICIHREQLGFDNIWLVSSDKDWDLLVDEHISRFSTVTRKETTLDNWDEHYDFEPDQYITFKCLTGDKGDNVPGVDGIGPKRAVTLMSEMGDIFDIANSLPLEGRYKYIQNLNEFGSDALLLNVELMDLKLDPVAHIGKDNAREILEKVEEYVDKNRLQ